MKFTDIIALAKQGFTPADIREFLKLDTEPEEASAGSDPAPVSEDPVSDPTPAAADPEPGETPAAEDPQQEPDYKQLYEEEKAKRQAAARKQEVAKDDSKSVEETLLDIAKMYI